MDVAGGRRRLMRVAFNATALLAPWAGVGQYTRNLANELLKLDGLDLEFFCGLSWSPSIRPAPLAARSGQLLPLARRFLPFSYQLRRFAQNAAFARQALKGRFDLYHEPNFLPMRFAGPTIVTVHDLSWIRYPQTHPVERVRALDRYFGKGLEQASLILTDSSFVREELLTEFRLPPERVRAVPLAASEAFQPATAAELEPTLAKYRLTPERYFLCVGTLEPRKNLQIVLQAYELLPPQLRERYPLILAGGSGWKNEALEELLGALEGRGQVRRLGYLPQADLVALTAGACTLVYPSLYEGFGLPPLEAMSCGVAPIVSNVASLPEVVGNAGIQVDPADVQALTEALRSLAEDDALRNRLGALSLHRSRAYSWPKCAAQTVDAYREVLASQ